MSSKKNRKCIKLSKNIGSEDILKILRYLVIHLGPIIKTSGEPMGFKGKKWQLFCGSEYDWYVEADSKILILMLLTVF
jgi:hypothetical protein